MKRRAGTSFILGLSAGLLLLLAAVVAPTLFYVHRAHALSNSGPDSADFGSGVAYYTLSNTADVANETSMGVAIYRAGSAPAGTTTISVAYQSGAGQCDNQDYQGNGGATFTYGSGGFRPGSINIPASAWTSDGVGYIVKIDATLQNGTNVCGTGADGNHVNFKLNAPGGFVVGPAGGIYFGVAQGTYCITYTGTPSPRSCNGYYNYSIPFAPPCTATSGGTVSAAIYDMDNTGHPVIQPSPASVQIIDTTANTVVNNNSYTGSEANGGTATFSFNYQPEHNYKLAINNVNANNVLQVKIPFDSVNAQVNCAPVGGITSSATAACTMIQGWTYDHNSPGTQLQYYMYVNPGSAPASTYSSPPSGSNFIGPFTANQANPPGTPGSVPANHGFQINVPADVTGHGYQGPWAQDDYYVYATDTSSGTLNQVASLTVPANTCANVSCGTSSFALQAVGEPVAFTVNMKVNGGATTSPPGNPTFTIVVTGSGGGTNNQTFTGVGDNPPSGGFIYSDPVTFTPTGAGTYSVTWSYYGTGGCGAPTQQAAYVPYFETLGGDTAAGPGFGGSCSETSAKIESWNLNQDFTPNYYGAGSEIGAWATGSLTNFVSGMGLSGGAASGNGYGLSFANTVNTSGNNYGGNFGSNAVPCQPDFYGSKPSGITTIGTSQVSNLDFDSGAYQATTDGLNTFTVGTGGDITVGQDSSGNGRLLQIYVKGNLYIRSNIKYSYSSLAQIPQVSFYVSGNIYIDPSVTEIHGVYIAQKNAGSGGKITTCAAGATSTPLPYSTCNQQLKVVGAMASEGSISMDRTYGNLVAATSVTNQPAEVFQYSPELWLVQPKNAGFKYQAYTGLPPVL